MIVPSGGCGEGVAARMQELASPDLYRRNAFRITGVDSAADNRSVREHRQRATASLAVGAPVEAGGELPLPTPVTAEQLRAAFDDLGDAQRRIVDELFWFWGLPDGGCACAGSLHELHDAAVRGHAGALDRELAARDRALSEPEMLERDRLWAEAADRWSEVLSRAAIWDHVRHRIQLLDDRRLDESAVDVIRDTLPRTLVTPLVVLAATARHPGRLVTNAARWQVGGTVVADLLADAATPLRAYLRTLVNQIRKQIEGATSETVLAGRPLPKGWTWISSILGAVDSALRSSVVPALGRLDELAPHERDHRTAVLRDEVAVLHNNCAAALLGHPRPEAMTKARRLLAIAHRLAVEPETRRTIEINQAGAGDLGGREDPATPPPRSTVRPRGSQWGIRALVGVLLGLASAGVVGTTYLAACPDLAITFSIVLGIALVAMRWAMR